MGADIHLYLEVQGDIEWQAVAPLQYDNDVPVFPIRFMVSPYARRDYVLFAALSGVRDDDATRDDWPLFDVCDDEVFPDGTSPQLRELWTWFVDSGIPAHSATMATLAELQRVDWTFLSDPSYRSGPVTAGEVGGRPIVIAGDEGADGALPEWQGLLSHMATLGPPESVRAVWWFDN